MSDTPTTVTTVTGETFVIEPGEYGTAKWWRQASLISKAYYDLGDTANGDKWATEAERRRRIWSAIEYGADMAAVIKQFGADLLEAPFRIAADIGTTVVNTAKTAVSTTTSLIELLPILAVGALIVLVVAASKGNLGVRA